MFQILSILVVIVCLVALVGTLVVGFNPKDTKFSSKRSFSILGLIYLLTIAASSILSIFVIFLYV